MIPQDCQPGTPVIYTRKTRTQPVTRFPAVVVKVTPCAALIRYADERGRIRHCMASFRSLEPALKTP